MASAMPQSSCEPCPWLELVGLPCAWKLTMVTKVMAKRYSTSQCDGLNSFLLEHSFRLKILIH